MDKFKVDTQSRCFFKTRTVTLVSLVFVGLTIFSLDEDDDCCWQRPPSSADPTVVRSGGSHTFSGCDSFYLRVKIFAALRTTYECKQHHALPVLQFSQSNFDTDNNNTLL